MKTRVRFSTICLALIAGLLVAAGLVAPTLSRSNCGGNTAALNTCKCYVLTLQMWASDHGGGDFCYSQADLETKRQLANLPGANWVQPARLMAKVENVRLDPGGVKKVVMVCDQAYSNVPQHLFWKAPMAHAVAYSTGETGLISPEQFKQLDLNGFIDLKTLGRTNSVTTGASALR